jgi:hypothetical protein
VVVVYTRERHRHRRSKFRDGGALDRASEDSEGDAGGGVRFTRAGRRARRACPPLPCRPVVFIFDPERQGPCLFLTLIEGRKVTNYKPILAKILRQLLQMSVISESIHRRLYLLTQQNTYSM